MAAQPLMQVRYALSRFRYWRNHVAGFLDPSWRLRGDTRRFEYVVHVNGEIVFPFLTNTQVAGVKAVRRILLKPQDWPPCLLLANLN